MLRDEDIEHLPPLVHEHINLHGRYYFGRMCSNFGLRRLVA